MCLRRHSRKRAGTPSRTGGAYTATRVSDPSGPALLSPTPTRGERAPSGIPDAVSTGHRKRPGRVGRFSPVISARRPCRDLDTSIGSAGAVRATAVRDRWPHTGEGPSLERATRSATGDRVGLGTRRGRTETLLALVGARAKGTIPLTN
uniref:Uncharacterized protein n=1 Tax=Human betaherpesvirus 6 TaxID=10368 RepID=A0A649Z5X7_9BETA|nr:hypothetical protein [Human betaherpesvirus 6]